MKTFTLVFTIVALILGGYVWANKSHKSFCEESRVGYETYQDFYLTQSEYKACSDSGYLPDVKPKECNGYVYDYKGGYFHCE